MDLLKKQRRFSFKLDGVDAFELPHECAIESSEDTFTSIYRFGGIKVTNTVKLHAKYGAWEWVNYFENESDSESGLITELYDCDCTLPLMHEDDFKKSSYYPDPENATKVYAPRGSDWSTREFYTDVDEIFGDRRVNHLRTGEHFDYCTCGGRSSDARAPFINVHKQSEGYIFAIGWSGQWHARVGRTNDSVSFASGIEYAAFRIEPYERFRTSSVVIMPYSGDVADGRNKWRRFVRDEFSILGEGRANKYGPLCANFWGGIPSALMLERIALIKENRLPFEYIWIDAGWFGETTADTKDEFEGDWWSRVGDWRVSPLIHPKRLEDVSEAVHSAGMKLVLWYEPERARSDTPIALEHPEYFLSRSDPNDGNLLLNLGNDAAWNMCYELLASEIERLKLDCLRIDFNFQPLSFWLDNDAEGRRGISEIKYINGFYRLWDALLKRFPRLLIDNCASGGRRIDIETLKRSVPMWRSDFECPANYDITGAQCQHQSFNSLLPYSGTGTGRPYDEYRVRSAYAASLATNYSYAQECKFCDSVEHIDFLQKYMSEYLRVRPYFSCDFYPLTEFSDKSDAWCANQFDRPESGDGIIQAFRRENSPYDRARFILRGLDSDAIYDFEDIDGGTFSQSGSSLCTEGAEIIIPEKRKAKIWFYRKADKS